MTAAAAIAIAEKSHPAFCTPSGDIYDYRVKSSKLMIVEPNHQFGLPGRLAWVIWLQPIRTHPMQYDDSQEVDVDAYNGQIIAVGAML
jgi:hypothetical protein